MINEDGEWEIHGVSEDDPDCIKTVDELEAYIDEVGFLPLFQNDICGFSVEERTVAEYWWTGHERDPWSWREIIAARGHIAYGKFFNKKSGFISKKWFPVFANYRRDGYDFDALWDDGKAEYRQKLIMDLFINDTDAEYLSHDIRKKVGFGKGGEKNFDGVMAALQMKTYLCMCDFRQKTNKKGEPYGWPVAAYCMPEKLFGADCILEGYREKPEESRSRIISNMLERFQYADKKQIERAI